MYGRTNTELSRWAFSKERTDKNPHRYSTTGFNWTKTPRVDNTLHATSNRHGGSTMQATYPGIWCPVLTTTVRQVYKDPMSQPKPTFRQSVSGRFTDFDIPAIDTGKSGYVQNNMLFDGKGWLPERNMHSDMTKTEYRVRYNTRKSLQKMATPTTAGKLSKRYATYDHDA
eukprot:TRINITY_DN6070_c0_g1_i23.p1 TRINITY_DN6070_c0_g1~~TRINITY_DN6070_c0_g1_i23.p1  ORF type:complete len:170 (-),score=33.16 TRINITY_DN6070_c0_g1_i23:184-693(-)